MSRARRWLIGVNIALLLLLALLVAAPATAQGTSPAAQARARGQYVVVPGKSQGSPVGTFWIMDTVNEELVALRWDRSGQKLETMGFRDLVNDAAATGKGR